MTNIQKWYIKNKAKHNQNSNKYYRKNKTKIKVYAKNYRKQNKIKIKESNRKRKLEKEYQMSQADYDQLYLNQVGLCAVCHSPFGDEIPRIDHNHMTNKVRGLVHNKCNLLLGLANDNLTHLYECIEYLSKEQKLSTLTGVQVKLNELVKELTANSN